jgi:hypothetical protein
MAIFNSFLYVYQRVSQIWLAVHHDCALVAHLPADSLT